MVSDYTLQSFSDGVNAGTFDAGSALQALQDMLNQSNNSVSNTTSPSQAPMPSGPVSPDPGFANGGYMGGSNMGGNAGPALPWNMAPTGVPNDAVSSWNNNNQQWSWQTPYSNMSVGIANPWQMSQQDRQMAYQPGGMFGSQTPNFAPSGPQNIQTGPDSSWIRMPGTYGVTGGLTGGVSPSIAESSFWNPMSGRSALDYIRSLGGAVPDSLSTLFNGQALSNPGNMSSVLNQLGGWQGGVPSPQSFMNMSPSELDYLSGFFESLLGIPMNDILAASTQPFNGLISARPSRQRKRRN